MKLYATTTSERATKGQGGNKYLSIEIKTDKTILTCCFIKIIEKDDDNIHLKITGNGKLRNGLDYIIPKEYNGKSQKGEKCPVCGEYTEYNPSTLHCIPL